MQSCTASSYEIFSRQLVYRLGAQAADAFDGTECVGQMIPRWVAEAVLRARLPHVPQLKCAFILYPAEARPSHLASQIALWLCTAHAA